MTMSVTTCFGPSSNPAHTTHCEIRQRTIERCRPQQIFRRALSRLLQDKKKNSFLNQSRKKEPLPRSIARPNSISSRSHLFCLRIEFFDEDRPRLWQQDRRHQSVIVWNVFSPGLAPVLWQTWRVPPSLTCPSLSSFLPRICHERSTSSTAHCDTIICPLHLGGRPID
jgi:hypothetical protein